MTSKTPNAIPPATLLPDQLADLLNQAASYHQQGQLDKAQLLYQQLLVVEPNLFDALHLLGVIFFQKSEFAQAEFYLEQALTINQSLPSAYYHYGLVLNALGHYQTAAEMFAKSIALKPDYLDAYLQAAYTLQQLGRYQEGLAVYTQILKLTPGSAEIFYQQAVLYFQLGEYNPAMISLDKAIAIKPDYVAALYNRSIILKALDKTTAAIANLQAVIQLAPDFQQAWLNLASLYYDLADYQQTLAIAEQLISRQPSLAEAYLIAGNVLHKLGHYPLALQRYQQLLAQQPAVAEAHYNCGLVLHEMQRYAEAIIYLEQAIRLKPDYAPAFNLRGLAKQLCHQYQAALADYESALAIQPEFAEVWNNRGNSLLALGQYTAALASFAQSLVYKPAFVEAISNQANVYQHLKQYPQALACYQHASNLKPDFPFLAGNTVQLKLQICAWQDLAETRVQLCEHIAAGEARVSPFTTLALVDDPALQLKTAQIWANHSYPVNPLLPDLPSYPSHNRIRIGYFSADFRIHPTAVLTAQLFESHDRQRYEVWAFYYGPPTQDEVRLRLQHSFDHFIDISQLADGQVVALVKSLEIDIAIDLAGYTTHCRTAIFAMRLAPIQINYLGYPGTMGAAFMDYLIADPVLIPATERQHIAENIIYLPNSYQVNDNKRPIAATVWQRAELGLPEQGFVFCCFNNNFKLNPAMFACWLSILQQVPGSVLWLLKDNEEAAQQLTVELTKYGLSPARLIFAERMPLAEHLARHQLADLFLDTLPCNAHTTASDALWAGLPLLTCQGRSFAARVAASLLTAIKLPELITSSLAEYQAAAVNLATHPTQLQSIRAKLAANRLTTPLFAIEQFTQHIETAFDTVYQRKQAGLAPMDIWMSDGAASGLV